mgnify:CR=1 FL=1
MNQEMEDQVLWSITLNCQPESLLVVDGLLFVTPSASPTDSADDAPGLYAVRLADGAIAWQHSFPHVMVTGVQTFSLASEPVQPTAMADQHLFLAATSTDLLMGEGSLLALDLKGQTVWRWSDKGQSISIPAVSQSYVAFVADSQRLMLLDPADGRILTQIALEIAAPWSAPLLRDDGIYLPVRGPELLALDLNGRLRWRFTTDQETWLDRTPLALGPLLITSGSDGSVYALRRRDGALQWRQQIGPAQKRLSTPISDGQRLYVGAADGLYALAIDDGRIEWYFATERTMEATPVLVGDMIYATCHDHHLYAIYTGDGTERWRYHTTRRIEVGPALGLVEATNQSLVMVADRGGTITAVKRQSAAVELRVTGQWEAAATAFATEGQPERAAALLAALTELPQAAQDWQAMGHPAMGHPAMGHPAMGRPEQVAEQFAADGNWEQAAIVWAALNRPHNQAEALVQHAITMTDATAYQDEDRAAVWQQAAQLYDSEGESLKASECWLEVTQYRRLPVITLDVDEHEGLVYNSWARLQFIVRNDGYGIARHMVVRASGSQFDLEEGSTRQFVALRPEQEQKMWLAARPCAYGDAVPLRVTIHYRDIAGTPHDHAQTVYLRVAQTEDDRNAEDRLPLFTGSTIPATMDPTRLRQLFNDTFDMADLRGLCFDLNVDFEGLRGESKPEKIMGLIVYMARNHRLEDLLARCRELRPSVAW